MVRVEGRTHTRREAMSGSLLFSYVFSHFCDFPKGSIQELFNEFENMICTDIRYDPTDEAN